RLGDPAEIAAAARQDEAPVVSRHFGTIEVLALVLMVLAWPLGVALLWFSKAWTTREKLIGSLVPPGGYPGVLIVMSTFPRLDTMSRGGAEWVLVATAATLFTISLLLVAAPIGTGIYLGTRLRAHPSQRER